MKKIALYPYDSSSLHLLLYQEMFGCTKEDIFVCISPRGWGYVQEDAGHKVGIHTGIKVSGDYEETIQDVDILLVTESIFPISNPDMIHKIKYALDQQIKVIVIRQGDLNFTKQIAELAQIYQNLCLYEGNKAVIKETGQWETEYLEEIPIPVVLVTGSGERCCKFEVQLEIRKTLLNKGYSVSQIGSKQYCELFGFHSFPLFMLDDSTYHESQKIIAFKKYIYELYKKEKPDIFIIGVPGGVFPFDHEFHNRFGITHFLVTKAVLPDYAVFCSLYIDSLAEYLSNVKLQIEKKFDYSVDQIFVSNHALDYAGSKADKELSYVICKTESIRDKIKKLEVNPIYDGDTKREAMDDLIHTLQAYTNLTIL